MILFICQCWRDEEDTNRRQQKVLAQNRTSEEKCVTIPQHADSFIQLVRKKKSKVDEFILHFLDVCPTWSETCLYCHVWEADMMQSLP